MLSKILKSKRGIVAEYGIVGSLVLLSFSFIIYALFVKASIRDSYYNSHYFLAAEIEQQGQYFYRACINGSGLSYKYHSSDYDSKVVDNGDQTYTFTITKKATQNSGEGEINSETILPTLEVQVNITTKEIIKWYFISPVLNDTSYKEIEIPD